MESSSVEILISGIVQGVGFRPFVYRLAKRLGVEGEVFNIEGGVVIRASAPDTVIERFVAAIRSEAPPMAKIESVEISPLGYSFEGKGFKIVSSEAGDKGLKLVSPDIAICAECVSEISDPSARRYRYSFTNCTNCGPRFTIIKRLPYDRNNTTMEAFEMCPECRGEYEDPLDRRFHAQPIACPRCGPKLQLLDSLGRPLECEDPLSLACQKIKDGNIVAIKGLGGYQIACDARSDKAVAVLRERKKRPHKPFALMVKDLSSAEELCQVSECERRALSGPEAPIVLLLRRQDAQSLVSELIAPGLSTLGLMLPYTPLHHLIFREIDFPLVMTSGNLSDEPIAAENDEAVERLRGIADYFLVHDRGIYSRYDDSVTFLSGKDMLIVRRARGFAPYPIKLPGPFRSILGLGPEYKNTFCLTKGRYAFVSQHIGDLNTREALAFYRHTLDLYKRLFEVEPEACAYDLHPDYFSTQFAAEMDVPEKIAVQHHVAHIASVMAEHALGGALIGVSLDGTGYGEDGRIWGGEVFVVRDWCFERAASFRNVRLPGGDRGIENPYRMAISFLMEAFGDCFEREPAFRFALAKSAKRPELEVLKRMIKKGISSPLTSSCGRIFDAVSAILGIRLSCSYEAQAAVELESVARGAMGTRESLEVSITMENGLYVMDSVAAIWDLNQRMKEGFDLSTLAMMFHNYVVESVAAVCKLLRREHGVSSVALSGGVFQNRIVLEKLKAKLSEFGFSVYFNRLVPINDGGISLGQAAYANFHLGG